MIYMCVLVSFTLQVNLSVNIVDMVPVVVNGTETEVSHHQVSSYIYFEFNTQVSTYNNNQFLKIV